jgi:hypothetical protein
MGTPAAIMEAKTAMTVSPAPDTSKTSRASFIVTDNAHERGLRSEILDVQRNVGRATQAVLSTYDSNNGNGRFG